MSPDGVSAFMAYPAAFMSRTDPIRVYESDLAPSAFMSWDLRDRRINRSEAVIHRLHMAGDIVNRGLLFGREARRRERLDLGEQGCGVGSNGANLGVGGNETGLDVFKSGHDPIYLVFEV